MDDNDTSNRPTSTTIFVETTTEYWECIEYPTGEYLYTDPVGGRYAGNWLPIQADRNVATDPYVITALFMARNSGRKKRADVRLSMMMISTQAVTITFLFAHYVTNLVEDHASMNTPIMNFIILVLVPSLGRHVITLLVICFNMETAKKKMSMVTVSGVVSSGRRRSTKTTVL
ncbi:unnamed protein product, partial [Mesorhabditis spiculigera]